MNSRELWLFLFIIGVLLFNWPFLEIFGMSLQYYLFGAWGIFILVVGLLIRQTRKQEKDKDV